MSHDCHLSLYVLILRHAIYLCITMNVFSVVQALNIALSFFVMLSCILYMCLYSVYECLSAQSSCLVYLRSLRAHSLTAILGRRSSAYYYTSHHLLSPEVASSKGAVGSSGSISVSLTCVAFQGSIPMPIWRTNLFLKDPKRMEILLFFWLNVAIIFI